MKAKVEVIFTLPIIGNTGYQNKSCLSLANSDLGYISLPKNQWNLESLRGVKFQNFQLGIPSGELLLENCQTTWGVEEITLKGEGMWSGKVDGLWGGMCGYGWFEAEIILVVEGCYLTGRSFYGAPSFTFYEPVKWVVYMNRKNQHQTSNKNWREEMQTIADLWQQKNNENLEKIQYFWDKLREWDKLCTSIN